MKTHSAAGFACLLTGLLVGGCSSYWEGMVPPTPTNVAGYVKEIQEASSSLGSMSPSEYLFAGIGYTNNACDTFFEDLGRLHQDSKFIDRAITSAITSGTALLAAFDAGKTALRNAAVAAAGLTAVNDLNKLVDEMYFFSKYKGSLRYQVRQQMSGYLTTDITGIVRKVEEYERKPDQRRKALIIARSIIEGYANLCSTSNLNQIVETAVAGGTSFRVAPEFPGRWLNQLSVESAPLPPADGLSGLVPNYRVGR